jgi:hypothetical protein
MGLCFGELNQVTCYNFFSRKAVQLKIARPPTQSFCAGASTGERATNSPAYRKIHTVINSGEHTFFMRTIPSTSSLLCFTFYSFFIVAWRTGKKRLFTMQRREKHTYTEVDTHINVSLCQIQGSCIKWSCRNCRQLKVYHTTAMQLDFQFRYVFTHATLLCPIDPSSSAHTRGFLFPGTRLFSFHFGGRAPFSYSSPLWFRLLVKFISSAMNRSARKSSALTSVSPRFKGWLNYSTVSLQT